MTTPVASPAVCPAIAASSDLGERWSRARLAALRSATPAEYFSGVDSESEMLAAVAPEDRDRVLRAVFENSRKLGRSHARHFGIVWELGDFREVFAQLPVPCLAGTWETRANALVLSRPGCQADRPSTFYCDYWREAVDGLVMGTSEDERVVRHSSVGHGDDLCVDVFFKDGAPLSLLRFGPIPEAMQTSLAAVRARFFAMRANVEFKGLSERTLYYEITGEGADRACGAGGRILHEHLRKLVRGVWPDVELQDASPLAVYGEKA